MSSQMIKQRKYRDISSEFLIELGKRLVKFRKSIAKTQIELATEYGKTHPATLGLWENGARPDPEYIKFLCDNYDANPGFFFLSEQFMFRQNNYLMPARIGAPRMSRDEYKSAVSAKINNLQGELQSLAEEIHTSSQQTQDLHEWHNVQDDEGEKLWYVKRDFGKAIDRISENMERMMKKIDERFKKLEEK